MRHTRAWTGDVYSIIAVLARYRPELTVIPVDTTPTGLLLVLGLDPQNETLADRYHEILAEHRQPDPQPVPEELMDRLSVLPPQRVLDANSGTSWPTPTPTRLLTRFEATWTRAVSLGDAFGRHRGGGEAA